MNRHFSYALFLTLLFCSLISQVAAAESSYGRGSESEKKTDSGDTHKKRSGKSSKTEEALFPSATRAEPELSASSALTPTLKKMFDAYQKNDFADAQAAAQQVLGNAKANAYDRALADNVSGSVLLQSGEQNYEQATVLFKKVIEENALPNNDHYQAMLQVAKLQLADEKYPDALTTTERFLGETRSDDPDVWVLKGNALYRLKRYDESIVALKKGLATKDDKTRAGVNRMLVAAYIESDRPNDASAFAEQAAAKNPTDKSLQFELAQIYQEADQPLKAVAVLKHMRSAGMVTEAKDYQMGYRLLAGIDGQDKDVIDLINEGLGKNILSPDYEVYNVLGYAYYNSDQPTPAIAAWSKAAPLDKDGETYLNLSKLQDQEQHWSDAKASAQQALSKGVAQPGDAWMTMASAEQGLGNKAAMIAAYREAAKHAESKKDAETMLRQVGAK